MRLLLLIFIFSVSLPSPALGSTFSCVARCLADQPPCAGCDHVVTNSPLCEAHKQLLSPLKDCPGVTQYHLSTGDDLATQHQPAPVIVVPFKPTPAGDLEPRPYTTPAHPYLPYYQSTTGAPSQPHHHPDPKPNQPNPPKFESGPTTHPKTEAHPPPFAKRTSPQPHSPHPTPFSPHSTHHNPNEPNSAHHNPNYPPSTHHNPNEPHSAHHNPNEPHSAHHNPNEPNSAHHNPNEPDSAHHNPNYSPSTHPNPPQQAAVQTGPPPQHFMNGPPRTTNPPRPTDGGTSNDKLALRYQLKSIQTRLLATLEHRTAAQTSP